MSIVDTNWLVPSGNPINTPPGVAGITGGTGVTITGTAQNPIINTSSGAGAVTSVEGLVGSIGITGGNGMTVTTTGQEITFTPTVQSLVAGSNCTIVESPSGMFTITNSGDLNPGNLTVVTQQYLSPATTSIIGGTVALNLQPITLFAVDPAKNSTVLLKLTLAGIGTKLSSPGNQNQISVGIFRAGPSTNTFVCGSGTNFQTSIDINWGTAITQITNKGLVPNDIYKDVTTTDYLSGNLNYGYEVLVTANGSPDYQFDNFIFNLDTIYII